MSDGKEQQKNSSDSIERGRFQLSPSFLWP